MTLPLSGLACWWCSPDCVGFFNGGMFHHPVWFICFVGVFSVTPSRLICSTSSGCLYHWRDSRPLLILSTSSDALFWHVLVDTCSLGRCSSPGEFHGVLNHSIPFVLIRTGGFFHLLSRTAAQGPTWPSPGDYRNPQA